MMIWHFQCSPCKDVMPYNIAQLSIPSNMHFHTVAADGVRSEEVVHDH